LAAQIPYEWKLDGTVRPGKRIFVEAMQDRLPPELLAAPKAGFGVPVGKWFRESLRPFLWDHLTGSQFRDRGICDPQNLNQLLTEHDSGRRNNSQFLWRLLMLEVWFNNQRASRSLPSAARSAVVCEP